MKKLLFIFAILMLSCVPMRFGEPEYADTYDFTPYRGKTIKFVGYYEHNATGGDVLKIWFTDGTTLNVYSYKYTMEIVK